MLLSIVMMIKNESKFLNQTLSSLKKLNENLNTELIIMDTGSDDDSVEIAKKYTDKVYIEKWNGNFAEMRNKSISYANGDWILILDADEVLIDYKKLVEFFNNEIFKKYNSASIKLKNIHSIDKSKYGYVSILRLFKNNDIKYIGRVHEQPTYKEPIYHDVAEFEHYGYLYEDDEQRIKKLKRNEELILKELEENPNDPYARYQLCQNFISEGKIKEAEIEAEKSFIIYKRHKVRVVYIYETLIRVYMMRQKYKKCEDLCKEYIQKDKNNIDVYYFLGMSQMKQYKANESINSLERYLYLINNYEISTQANDAMSQCNTIGLKDVVLSKLITLYSELEYYEKVLETFELIESIDKKRKSYNYLIESLVKLKKEKLILKYNNAVNHSYRDRKNLYDAIEYFLSSCDEKTKNHLYEILSDIDGDYGYLNKIRVSKDLNLQKAIELLKRNEKDDFYGSILDIVVKNNIDIYELFKEIDNLWIYKYGYYALSNNKEISRYIYDYLVESLNTFDMEKIRVYKVISELVLNTSKLSIEKYKIIMYLYTMYSYQYIKSLYNNLDDEILMKHLGENDRFVIKFRQLLEFNNKNSIEYVNELKTILNQYPQHNRIMGILIKEAEENIKRGKEFEELRNLFISNIKIVVENNKLNEADKLVDEYLINFKEDKEILNIKGVIQIMKGDFYNANITLKKALTLDINNEDLIYNINYLNEILAKA